MSEIKWPSRLEQLNYEQKNSALKKEINWGSVNYVADRNSFRKTDAERGTLATLKHKWRKLIQAKGECKRHPSYSFLIKI